MVFFGKRVSMRNTIRLFPKTLAYHSSWKSPAATLTTALRRASSGLLAVSPVQALGPMTFNPTFACNSLPPCCCWPCWRPEAGTHSARRLEPRRNSVLFLVNAPCTAVLGFFILGKHLNMVAITNVALAMTERCLRPLSGKPAPAAYLARVSVELPDVCACSRKNGLCCNTFFGNTGHDPVDSVAPYQKTPAARRLGGRHNYRRRYCFCPR